MVNARSNEDLISDRHQGRDRKSKKRISVKSREWVLSKKARQRRQGKDVRPDTKYSGRKRGPKYVQRRNERA